MEPTSRRQAPGARFASRGRGPGDSVRRREEREERALIDRIESAWNGARPGDLNPTAISLRLVGTPSPRAQWTKLA